jgi:orotate phosphoribosyltransferase
MNTISERLLEILRRDCLLRGRFKLASGAETDTYLDCRKLWRSHSLGVVSRVLLDLVESLSFFPFDTVGALGAGSVLLGSFLTRWRMGFGEDLDGFCLRDQPKNHGVQSAVDGWLKPGAHVLLLDDVLTSGSSLRRVEKVVLEAGGCVVGACVLVDRQAQREPLPWPVRSVFTLAEIAGDGA